MSQDTELLNVAKGMADRLKIWQKLRIQAEERGETTVELHPAELFETQDRDALAAWENYLKIRAGERPLLEVE